MRVKMSEPGGAVPVTGNQPRTTAKTTSRMTPLTNSGMTVSDRLVTLMERSSAESRRRAASTPSTIDVGTMMTRAMPASSMELASASKVTVITGRCRMGDSPQSPVMKPPSQRA